MALDDSFFSDQDGYPLFGYLDLVRVQIVSPGVGVSVAFLIIGIVSSLSVIDSSSIKTVVSSAALLPDSSCSENSLGSAFFFFELFSGEFSLSWEAMRFSSACYALLSIAP